MVAQKAVSCGTLGAPAGGALSMVMALGIVWAVSTLDGWVNLTQPVPGIQAGAVAVRKHDPNGVIANELHVLGPQRTLRDAA